MEIPMTIDSAMPEWARNLRLKADASTPGPWYVRRTDDPSFMAAYYVTSERGADSLDVEEWAHPTTVVAITLLQDPSRAVTPQCSENAEFIAALRTGVPRLYEALEKALSERAALLNLVRQVLSAEARGNADEKRDNMDRVERLLSDLGKG
jgi:hypothetical protein